MELLFVTVSVAFTAGYIVRGELDDRDQSGQVEQYLDNHRAELQERYETTQMDYIEFEDHITVLEFSGTERIMRDAIQVDGIGVETPFETARTFQGDYKSYRDTGRDDLERVNGVGENRATALLNH